MRKLPYQFGTSYDPKPAEDPWRRRMPAQIYIGRDLPKRSFPPAPPVTFGLRRERTATVVTTTRRFSLARLVSLFQGPRNTRRTKAR